MPKTRSTKLRALSKRLLGAPAAKRFVFAAMGIWVLGAMLFGLFGNSANAVIVSSNSDQCRVDVGNSTSVSISLQSTFCVVEFRNVGTTTFTAPPGVRTVDVLVVGGGGGGGGQDWAGGGGAGGVLVGLGRPVTPGTSYQVIVGAGGAGGPSTASNVGNNPGSNGDDSRFDGVIARGGGGGAGRGWGIASYQADGRSGGSGGGAGEDNGGAAGGSSNQPSFAGWTPYGNKGGDVLATNGSQAGAGGGGAGAPGGNVPSTSSSSNRQPGNGGSGRSETIGGKTFRVAAGGGGASSGTRGVGGSADGTKLGGDGGNLSAGQDAVASTGSGGGGAQTGTGGSGSSGLVVIAYTAPSLHLSTQANGARVGEDFIVQPVLQLRDSANQPLSLSGVTITASVSNGTATPANVTATTNASGVATFSNLRFSAGNLGLITLRYSAPGYLDATQTIKLQTLSAGVTVSTSANANGNFVQGFWLADSQGPSTVNNSTLQTELSNRAVTIQSTGSITVSAAVSASGAQNSLNLICGGSGAFTNSNGPITTGGPIAVTCASVTTSGAITAAGPVALTAEGASSAVTVNANITVSGSGNSLTLKSARDVRVELSRNLSTVGGDVVLWSDSNEEGGGVVRLLNDSQICTTSGTCGTQTTGGGNIFLGGGAADPSNSLRPGGFAAGYGTTYNTTSNVQDTTGVQLGTLGTAGGARLYSAGGQISLRGTTTEQNTITWKSGVAIVAGSVIDAGAGKVLIEGTSRSANNDSRPIVFSASGANGSVVTVSSKSTAPDSITVMSYSAQGATNHGGLGFGSGTTTLSSDGGLIVQADRVLKGMGFQFNVSGPISFEPKPGGTSLLNSTNATVFDFELATNPGFTKNPSALSIGSSSNTSPITIRQNLATTTGDIKVLTSGLITKPANFTMTAGADVIINGGSSNVTLDAGAVSGKNVKVSLAGAYSGAAPLTATDGQVSITSTGSSVTTSGAITAAGPVALIAEGASSAVTVGANITSTSLGSDLLLKSKSNVVINPSGVTLQTAGKSASGGGRIILWSDSDASGQGFIALAPNTTLNSIGGSTTTFTGGGDIHLAGGADNGSTTVSPNAVANDGLPDGWAISTQTDEHGVHFGKGATSASTTNRVFSGGGNIKMFGKNTTENDAISFTWTSRIDSGQGQIEFRAESAGWGLQLNRGSGATSYGSNKSVITSRSNTHPAVQMHAKSTGNADYAALLGSWAGTGSDNLLIQAVGDGGIDMIADGPTNFPALALTSTAVLSKSGKITLDGGTSTTTGNGAIHFGMLRHNHEQGQVQIGDCAVATCSNSLVADSTADVEIIGNRVASYGSLATTVSTAGALAIVPASNSKEFTDFQGRTAGLTLAEKLGGLQIGRPGDTTGVINPTMEIQKAWKVAGPITVNAGRIYVRESLETTNSSTAPIRLISMNQIYLNPSKSLTTDGSDVVFWSGADKVAGTVKPNSTIYLDTSSTIRTNGGKIWLAGGLDDGGVDASITSSRGKWSSVVANDGYPDGYAVGENSTNQWSTGVLLESNVKLLSGGGDIFIAGAMGPSGLDGQAHIAAHPGVQIDSGEGRIAMWGRSLGSKTTQGIGLHWGNDGAPVVISSDATTADAISVYSDSSLGGSWSRGVTALWYSSWIPETGHQGVRLLATGSGGGITLSGIGSATGDTNLGVQGLRLGFIDILAKDGPITLNGASGPSGWAPGISFGWENNSQEAVRLGAWTAGTTGASGGNLVTTPGGTQANFATSSSNVTINADGVWMRQSGNGMWGVYVGTTGDFKILPAALSSGLISPAANFKFNQNSLDWSFEKLLFELSPASVQIGRQTTTTPITVAPLLKASGAIQVYGSSLVLPGGFESVNGPVEIYSSSTVALNSNVSSGADGILVKSAGRITSSPGASAASPRLLGTSGGPITLWTTGTAGGVALGNFTQLNTTQAGAAGADITIGGGTASAGDDTKPGSAAKDSGIDGIKLGTTSNTSGVVIRSGTGTISLSGEYTGTSTFSGVRVLPGVDILGANVIMKGVTGHNLASSNFAAGIDFYAETTLSSAKNLIHATANDSTQAIQLISESASQFGSLIGPKDWSGAPDFITLRASGNTSGISISGQTSRNLVGVWLAAATLETKDGPVSIDSGGGSANLGLSTRLFTYRPVMDQSGGNITITTANYVGAASTSITTEGIVSVLPTGTSFVAAQTFPAASSTTSVGGLIVGSATNTANLTAGSAITSSGDVIYRGGAQTANFAITTTGTGNIEFYPTSTFSRTTGIIDAAGKLKISGGTSNANTGTGTISAADVELSASGNITYAAPTTASNSVSVEALGTGTISLFANIAAGSGGIFVKSVGRITASAGTNTAEPRQFATESGPITFWTTGTAGGVAFGNYTRLDTTLNSSDGADITIGGGDPGTNPNRPAGTAKSSGADGVRLGTSSQNNGIVMTSGTGAISIAGEYTTLNSSNIRGVKIYHGANIVGNTVSIVGVSGSNGANGTGEGAGVSTWEQSDETTLIQATGSFDEPTAALTISATSRSDTAAQLGTRIGNTAGVLTLRASGNNGGITITGSTSEDKTTSQGVWLASTTIETKNGPTFIDAGDDAVALGGTSSRLFRFQPVSGEAGGDLTVISDRRSIEQAFTINTAGAVSYLPNSDSFGAATIFPAAGSTVNVGNLVVGKATNTAALTVGAAVTSTGNITYFGSSFAQSSGATLTSTGSGSVIKVVADRTTLTQNISASNNGVVAFETRTTNRPILVSTSDSASSLWLTPTELQTRVSALTLRLGNRETTGNVVFNSSVNLTGKVQNLAIRSAGNVSGAAGVVITVANLGIDAGGTIDFPGNQSATVIALASTAISYNQASAYSVAVVDGIAPEYGLGVKFAVTNAPTTTPQDAFMNIAFNPPPVVQILDKFDNVLESNNLSAADFSVAVTPNFTSTTGTPELADTTPIRIGGEFSFDELNVAGGTGNLTLTFAVTTGTAPNVVSIPFNNDDAFTPQALTTRTTGIYKLQAGEPDEIVLTFAALTAPAGKTGLAPTATLKDSAGNTIATGPHAEAAITISIDGADGVLVSGETATASAGVASFPNLVVGGKVNTDYTLTFSVTFTDTQDIEQTKTATQIVTLTPGDAAALAFDSEAQTVANRKAIGNLVISVRDDYGNVVTDSSAAVELALSVGASTEATPVLNGYSSAVAAEDGVATISGLSLAAKVDTYTITASSGTLTTATQAITITHGIAHSIVLTSPATTLNDTVFGTQPIVEILDQDGNPVTTGPQSTQAVTLTASGATLSGVDAEALSMQAVAGVADFAGKDLKLTGTIGTKTITATITNPGSITATNSITITFGAATKLAITTPAAGFVNRTQFTTQPIVTVQDVSGNTVTNFNGTITLSTGTTNILTGTTSITLANQGVATFSGLGVQGTVGAYTITASSGTLTTATQAITITHGIAHSIVLTSPATTLNDTVFGTQPIVEILDEDGNRVTTGAQSTQAVTLTASGATLTGVAANALSMNASDGVADFAGKDLKLTGTIGTKTITATITNPGNITDTNSIAITFGSATKLAITREAAGFVNRTQFSTQPIVTVQDVSGNTVTNFAGNVSLTIGSGASITGDTTLTLTAANNGVANFSGLGVEGTIGAYTITASSGTLTTATQAITITHGAATKITIEAPSTATNNVALSTQPVVRIFDADDNPVISGAESELTVTLTASGATLSGVDANALSMNAVLGVADFAGKDLKLTGTTGTKSITATILNPGSITAAASIELGFGAATKLAITREGTSSTPPATSVVNGTNFTTQPIVTVQDQSGNTVEDFAGKITLAIAPPQGQSRTAAFTGDNELTLTAADNGVANFSGLGVEGIIGDYTITASSTGLADATQDITITFGSATKLAITREAAGFVNRTQFSTQPIVTVQDVSGNTVTNFNGTITLSTGTTNILTGTTSITLANQGVATFSGLGVQGTVGDYTLTAKSTGLADATQDFTLAHGAAHSISLTSPATTVNDTVFGTQPIVEILDEDGNPVTTGPQSTQAVTLTASGATLSGVDAEALSMQAVAGVADFAGKDLKLTGTIGTKTLAATITSPTSITATNNITITFGTATKLAITTPAAGFVNRTQFTTQPIVTVQDVSGNTVEDFEGDVTLTIAPPVGQTRTATITGDTTLTLSAANNGVANFSGLGVQGTVGSYTITTSSTGLADATQDITITHGAATAINFVQEGDGARSGQVFDDLVRIEIVDADDNRVTSGAAASASIQVAKEQPGYSSGGANFGGSISVPASLGLAEFTNLTLSGKARTYDLTFTWASPPVDATVTELTQLLDLAAGTRNALAMVTQPQNAIAGVDFETSVQVEIVDAWLNRVLTESGTEVVVSAPTVAAGALRGTLTRPADKGLITFPNLNVTKIGTFKLHFITAGLSVLQSADFTIEHAPASQIVVDGAAPTAARNDIVFSPAPSFRILDEFSNPVTSGPKLTVTATVVSTNKTKVLALTGDVVELVVGTEALSFNSLKLKAPADDYGLRFTVTGGANAFFVETDDDVTLTFGDAVKIAIETPAAGARAGIAFDTQPIIEVRDSAENVVGDSSLRVTASHTGGGRTLIGATQIDAVNGVARFTDLGIQGTVANGLLLTFAAEPAADVTFTASQSIDLLAGNATKFRISQQPGAQVVTRVAFSPHVAVELLDNDNNLVLADNLTNVTVNLYGSNGAIPNVSKTETAVAAVTAQAEAGVATFEDLAYAVAPGEGYYLKFSLGAFSLDSTTFTVLPGAVASIVIDTQPSTTNGDFTLVKTGELLAAMPKVSLYDADDYLADNAVGSVTVSIASGSGGDLTEGTTTATIVGGRATFAGVKLVGTPAQRGVAAEQYTLKFSHAGVDSPASNALSVTHNVSHKLVITRDAASGRAGEAFETQPIVEIRDRYNNLVESSSQAIRVGASAGGSVTGREKNAVNGIATFSSLALGGLTTNTYSLTFEIPDTQVDTATQSGITITFGVADRLVLTTAPKSLDADEVLTKTGSPLAVQPVIEVRDAHGNRVENAASNIVVSYVATRDVRDRLVNATATAVNGIATFEDLTMVARPGQIYRLSFTSGTLTNTQSGDLQVRHGDAHSIEIVTQPSAVIDAVNGILTRTGNALHVQPSIRVLDFDENHADTISGVTVVASVIEANATNYALTDLDSNGQAFNEAEITNGEATFSALRIVATPGVAKQLEFTAIFNIESPPGEISITSPASDPITVTNALAHSLALHIEPCAGAVLAEVCQVGITGNELAVQPVIKVLDEFGNLVVDHVGNVVVSVRTVGARLSVGDDSVDVALRTIAVSGGYAVFAGLELTATPGEPVKLNFASDELTGVSSRDLIVAAAAPARIEMVTNPVSARTGDLLSTQPTVKIVDRFGNTVLADSGTLVKVAASGGLLFKDPATEGDPIETGEQLVAQASAGIVTFSGLKFTGTPLAPYSLSFTSTGLSPVTSATFTVTNAFANQLLITQQPIAGKTADLLTQMPKLKLEDFDDNLAEDDNSTVVTVSIDVSNGAAWFVDANDVRLTTNPTAMAVEGLIEFSGLRIEANPGTVYKLNFTAQPATNPDTQVTPAAFSSAPSAELVFTHANPAQLTVRQSAIGGVAGLKLVGQPELQVRDRFGNPATGDNATVVTATLASGVNGSVVSGATTAAENGIVRFTNLTLDGLPSETYTLQFAATPAAGDSFSVTDPVEFTLSRQVALTLNFTDVAYAPDAVVTPVFTSDSLGAVTWTTSTDPSICVLELDQSEQPTGNVIVKGVGTCSLRASVARDEYVYPSAPTAAYTPAEISANLVISKATQTPLVISSADNVDFRGNLTLATTGGSGDGTITFWATGDCRVIGGMLIPGEAGATCRIRAEKAEDANYLEAISTSQTVTINRIAQQPLRIVNSNSVSVGDIELVVAGGSGTGAISFQVSTVGTAQCEIVGSNVLRATQNGECGVMATKQASTNHLIAISPEVTFTFSKATQTVNFTSAVPPRPSPGMFYDPVAVASSGLPVTITISAGEGTACQFDTEIATRIRFMTSGSCEITATQPGNSQFVSASTTQALVVNALNQSITFASLADLRFGDPNFQLAATASSGLPVSYRVGTTFVDPACSVTATGRVTLIRAGRCEIIASQAGNSTYLPAPDVTQIFTVSPDQAGAPHLISVSTSNSAIVAKFRAPTYLGGSTVSAYRLEATAGNGDRYVNPGCQPLDLDKPCELVGMPLNQAYTVRVAAVTAAGIGVFSSDSLPVTPGATEIAVAMLSANQVSGQLNINWEPPVAFDGEFESYEVYVWPLNTDQPDEPSYTSLDAQADSVSFEITAAAEQEVQRVQLFSAFSIAPTVEASISYNIKVVTLTDESTEAFDSINVASGVQLGLGAPARPRNEQLTVMSDRLLAAWSPPAFDGGSDVIHYIVSINGIEQQVANQLGSLFVEHPELRAGQTYEILIYAVNKVNGRELRSEPAILTHSIPAPPAPPAPAAPPVEEEESTEVKPAPSKPAAPTPDAGSKPRPTPSPSDLLNGGDSGDASVDQGDSDSALAPGPGGGAGTGGPGSGTGDGTDVTDGGTDTDRDQSKAAGGDVQDQGALQLMLWLLVGLALTLLLRRYALRQQLPDTKD